MTNFTLGGRGTLSYTAPETIGLKKETHKVDMWALGIMLYQFVS